MQEYTREQLKKFWWHRLILVAQWLFVIFIASASFWFLEDQQRILHDFPIDRSISRFSFEDGYEKLDAPEVVVEEYSQLLAEHVGKSFGKPIAELYVDSSKTKPLEERLNILRAGGVPDDIMQKLQENAYDRLDKVEEVFYGGLLNKGFQIPSKSSFEDVLQLLNEPKLHNIHMRVGREYPILLNIFALFILVMTPIVSGIISYTLFSFIYHRIVLYVVFGYAPKSETGRLRFWKKYTKAR